MDVVLRPVNDRFLTEVAFPAFEIGVADAAPALERFLEALHDEQTTMLIDLLLTRGVEGNFFTLEAERWMDAVYRILFSEWIHSGSTGWEISADYVGFAGALEESLHLAMMVEDPSYPYWDPPKARQARVAFFGRPEIRLGLSAFLCGRWDPFPSFPPDQVLATRGRDPLYNQMEDLAIADWSYRSAGTVALWADRLPGQLRRLLRRELERLDPIAVPERDDIFEYWMGHRDEPPLITVAFSGLGTTAPNWVRELGGLTHLLREAANLEQGLTSIIVPSKGYVVPRGG